MLKFKTENLYNKYGEYSNHNELSYESIKNFSEEHHLDFGIIKYDEDKDTLYICTNGGRAYVYKKRYRKSASKSS